MQSGCRYCCTEACLASMNIYMGKMSYGQVETNIGTGLEQTQSTRSSQKSEPIGHQFAPKNTTKAIIIATATQERRTE